MTTKPIKHYTASAIILTDTKPHKVLLVHHKKFNKWIQPGGHQESWENPVEAAIRETQEETSIDITPHLGKIVPLGEYTNGIPLPDYILEERIPEHKNEPDHYHIDLQYVVHIPLQSIAHQPEESHGIGWFTLEEVERLSTFDELKGILRKEMAS